MIHKDYVVFDPLPEDTFGANVHLILATEFSADLRAQRRIVVPFFVSEMDNLELASATEKVKITLDLDQRHYALHYEICEGDEIFYKITFVPSVTEPGAKFLMDDPWGGVAGHLLVRGTA